MLDELGISSVTELFEYLLGKYGNDKYKIANLSVNTPTFEFYDYDGYPIRSAGQDVILTIHLKNTKWRMPPR